MLEIPDVIPGINRKGLQLAANPPPPDTNAEQTQASESRESNFGVATPSMEATTTSAADSTALAIPATGSSRGPSEFGGSVPVSATPSPLQQTFGLPEPPRSSVPWPRLKLWMQELDLSVNRR